MSLPAEHFDMDDAINMLIPQVQSEESRELFEQSLGCSQRGEGELSDFEVASRLGQGEAERAVQPVGDRQLAITKYTSEDKMIDGIVSGHLGSPRLLV